MITILIEDSPSKKIIVDGHANYSKRGQDIVCAGVSAIVTGTINALEKITCKTPKYKIGDGHSEIEFDNDKESQTIMETMIIQLKTIEESYPKNVKIKYSQSEV